MATFPIKRFGLGRITDRPEPLAPPGSAADSLNLLHNNGDDTAELRPFIDRVNATDAAAPALMLHELVNAAGTATLLAKCGTALYTWSLTPATAMTSLLGSLEANRISGVCTANGLAFVTDYAVKNYVTDGTAAHTHELQKTGPQGSITTTDRAGQAVGNAAGTINYYFTDTEPTTGEETPASSADAHVRAADAGVAITGLTYTGHFTGKNLYRIKYGGTQPYRVVALTANATATRARASNVATITTTAAHSLQVGQSVTISGLGAAAYNVTADVASTPTTTSFTYANTGADEGSTADTAGTVYKAGYLDDTLDTALSTASVVHDADGVASIEKPEAAKYTCFFRGRLFLGCLSGHLSRIRWSKVLEPTQFSNATTARFDVGKNDGSPITGIVPFRGSLVIFKKSSIWVLNGDQDETTFAVAEAVPGIGCVAPWSIRRNGDTCIYFLSEQGVCSFDLGSVERLSEPITPNDLGGDLADRWERFVAGVETVDRLYLLSVAPVGATTNTKTHVLNLDTGHWSRFEFCMGQVTPSCYSDTGQNGPVHNSNGQVRLYFGDETGFVYQMRASTTADGVTSGTSEATVTGYTSGTRTITCSAAAFRTTGSGLKAISVTLRRAADSSFETKSIDSCTGTTIVHATGSWTTNPAVGDTIFIGAIQATLALNRIDLGTNRKKRWIRLEIEHEKQSATTPLKVGYTLDADTAPTASTEYAMNNGFFIRATLNHRRSVGMAPYLSIVGTNYDLRLIRMTIDAEVLAARRPVR